ncbi:hypothetical protein [Hymenobacter metallicola]|uniref:Uncharacterized protein n=1 Tax=Hymenobacter metallicola TaxID=2563114 RepID=A0A4Z0QK28_9BACT|nr:hypothetical protein [Hymenobacter metallicola]TGE29371.1 hypothetical protein E5K02_07930 [Hymenobacter metallicola]
MTLPQQSQYLDKALPYIAPLEEYYKTFPEREDDSQDMINYHHAMRLMIGNFNRARMLNHEVQHAA